MKIMRLLILFALVILGASCSRSSQEIMGDTQTAGRYFGRGFHSLLGNNKDSQQVTSQEDFMGYQQKSDEDFIPLTEGELYESLSFEERQALATLQERENKVPQPKESPGDPNSSVPGIDAFSMPAENPQLASVFKHIFFSYNSNLVKGERALSNVRAVANYLKKHPKTYVFIEGHCDERGSREYNLALGSRRSNAVRALLVKSGVNPDHIFTISYGKERPLLAGTGETVWSQNRRAEFRVSER